MNEKKYTPLMKLHFALLIMLIAMNLMNAGIHLFDTMSSVSPEGRGCLTVNLNRIK